MRTKDITYTAVSTAIATVFIVLTLFLPTRIVPLIVSAVCYYIAFNKCSYIGGLLSIACSLLITFFISGISTSFLLVCIIFAPYALLAHILRRIRYDSLVHSIIRLIVMIVFGITAFIVCYFLAGKLTNIDVMALVNKIGAVLACLIVVIAALPTDFFFTFIVNKILKFLK